MLPMMVILTMLMIKINTVIQISLVNQKYSRSHALALAMNSPYFPGMALRTNDLTNIGYNQMIIGVSAIEILDGSPPMSMNYSITRPGVQGSEDRMTPPERSKIRVRSTVSMCTQQNVLADGRPILPVQSPDRKVYTASGPYGLGEASKFELCRSRYNE
ncbi:MAG: hypothetical protein A2070_15340 [Bdellovibrionales bacterium GWC1_52_8]|nr:MAG: hypothetical protein A2070_15340 [Bdellovibrionales bacterium GWC1_52_8]